MVTNEPNKKNLNNAIEGMFQQAPENNNEDANALFLMGIVEILGQKVDVVKEYLSDDQFKTEITKSQRKILPIMAHFALTPYPSIIEFNIKRMIKLGKSNDEIKEFTCHLMAEFKLDILDKFVKDFMAYGVAVNRQGRKEDGLAINSLMSETIELLRNRGGNGKGGL